MATPTFRFDSIHPETLSMDVLFPEHYEASKRMIVRDFATMGATIVFGVIGISLWLNLAA